jgi:hypothetical protein
VSRYNCCILGTFGTPQQAPPTIYYTPPRFILKDPGVQLNWEILQKPVIIRIPRVTPGLDKVQEPEHTTGKRLLQDQGVIANTFEELCP